MEVMYKQETEPIKTMAQGLCGFLCISFHRSGQLCLCSVPLLFQHFAFSPLDYSDVSTPDRGRLKSVFTCLSSPEALWKSKQKDEELRCV